MVSPTPPTCVSKSGENSETTRCYSPFRQTILTLIIIDYDVINEFNDVIQKCENKDQYIKFHVRRYSLLNK